MSTRNSSSNNKVFVGKLSRRTRSSDLEDEFSKFGKIKDVDLRGSYAFIVNFKLKKFLLTNFLQEFEDSKEADEAIHEMDGRNLDSSRIIVQYAGNSNLLIN